MVFCLVCNWNPLVSRRRSGPLRGLWGRGAVRRRTGRDEQNRRGGDRGIFSAAGQGDGTAAIAEAMKELWQGGGWSPERILADASAATERNERAEVPLPGETTSEGMPEKSVEPADSPGPGRSVESEQGS